MEENLHGFGFGNQFLDMIAKAQSVKNNRLGFIKLNLLFGKINW